MYTSPVRIQEIYQVTRILGIGSFGTVYDAFNMLTGAEVAIKTEMPPETTDSVAVLPYEYAIYEHLRENQGIPRVHWFGMYGGAHVLVLDKLGANLQQVRRLCRGQLTLKTILMLAEQMLTRVEFVHSRGVILRDIKPENFAMGLGRHCNVVHLFDFGLAKLFVDPLTEVHIPFREGLVGLGTPRYTSANVHFGREQGRRDDIEALGFVLLFLLHGKLPWQGIYAPSYEAKLRRIGEMKIGKAFDELLTNSPPEFRQYFDHCRGLSFDQKPDYVLLKNIFRERMGREGWLYDWQFDWLDASALEKGTLITKEYKIDLKFVEQSGPDWYLPCI
ncbi:Casein kinase I [Grifola frondosa]|uniref:Casein kinase I n=1 Tax=Grifola frondosa TaxID=5627 RepID=A0A1C7MRI2_GRIFR|nr:Casein kinase I [Grifola frondosa]